MKDLNELSKELLARYKKKAESKREFHDLLSVEHGKIAQRRFRGALDAGRKIRSEDTDLTDEELDALDEAGDQLDEVSKALLGRYIKKSRQFIRGKEKQASALYHRDQETGEDTSQQRDKLDLRASKRNDHVELARQKVNKSARLEGRDRKNGPSKYFGAKVAATEETDLDEARSAIDAGSGKRLKYDPEKKSWHASSNAGFTWKEVPSHEAYKHYPGKYRDLMVKHDLKEEELDELSGDLLRRYRKAAVENDDDFDTGPVHNWRAMTKLNTKKRAKGIITATKKLAKEETDLTEVEDDQTPYYIPKPEGEKRFWKDHIIQKHKPVAGTPDWVFNGSTKKDRTRKADRDGYEGDVRAYEKVQESLDEGVMSPAEKATRERIVHGMKKRIGDFKKKYGSAYKDVVYATATARALGEEVESLDEAIEEYKHKHVKGLYTFNHYEHPNGSFIQVSHSKKFKAFHNDTKGNIKEFDKYVDLRDHINKLKEETDLTELSHSEKSTIVKKAEKGEDLGSPGKNFKKIENSAAKEYGSRKAGERVAGAIFWKKMAKEDLDLTEETLASNGSVHIKLSKGIDKVTKKSTRHVDIHGAGQKQRLITSVHPDWDSHKIKSHLQSVHGSKLTGFKWKLEEDSQAATSDSPGVGQEAVAVKVGKDNSDKVTDKESQKKKDKDSKEDPKTDVKDQLETIATKAAEMYDALGDDPKVETWAKEALDKIEKQLDKVQDAVAPDQEPDEDDATVDNDSKEKDESEGVKEAVESLDQKKARLKAARLAAEKTPKSADKKTPYRDYANLFTKLGYGDTGFVERLHNKADKLKEESSLTELSDRTKQRYLEKAHDEWNSNLENKGLSAARAGATKRSKSIKLALKSSIKEDDAMPDDFKPSNTFSDVHAAIKTKRATRVLKNKRDPNDPGDHEYREEVEKDLLDIITTSLTEAEVPFSYVEFLGEDEDSYGISIVQSLEESKSLTDNLPVLETKFAENGIKYVYVTNEDDPENVYVTYAIQKEPQEEITELSKNTLKSYINRAADDRERAGYDQGRGEKPLLAGHRAAKRKIGIGKAVDKLAKEETEIGTELDEGKWKSGRWTWNRSSDHIKSGHTSEMSPEGKAALEKLKAKNPDLFGKKEPKKDVKEENLDELSHKTLGDYIKQAKHSMADSSALAQIKSKHIDGNKEMRTAAKRNKGIDSAVNVLTRTVSD